MADRYREMRSLRDSLEMLFGLCGIQGNKVEIRPAPGLVRAVERIAGDQTLCRYLKELGQQAQEAAEKLKEQQLDVWNSRQNEVRLEQLEEETERQRGMLAKYEEEQEQLRRLLAESERELEMLQQEKLAGEAEKIAAEAGAGRPENGEWEESQRNMILDLIAMSDSLLMQRDWLRENAPEDAGRMKLILGQADACRKILMKAGVEILEDEGHFDSSRHTVVDTRPADEAFLADQIAEIFRPGYIWRGEVIRGEEVILYTWEGV